MLFRSRFGLLSFILFLTSYLSTMRIVIENQGDACLRFASDYIVKQINAFAPTEGRLFTTVLPSPTPNVLPL